jgi:hypothetical protein
MPMTTPSRLKKPSHEQRAYAALQERGLLTLDRLDAEYQIPKHAVHRACAAGLICRLADRLYGRENLMQDAEAAALGAVFRVRKGAVAVLDTAAKIHGITTDNVERSGLWLAIPYSPSVCAPRIPVYRTECGDETVEYALKVARWRDHKMTGESGVEVRDVHGFELPVTSPARTCIDLCRAGDQPLSEVAEWTRAAMSAHGFDADELRRVAAVIRADISELLPLVAPVHRVARDR